VIAEAARKNDLSFPLLKALIHVESYFNPNAISKKGALGLMQIMPENLDALNVSRPFDPLENVMGGASYLKNMINRFDGKLELALAAYNAGPTAVEKYSDIPPYRETQEYVQKVLKLYKQYKDT
jgi:soluble lytic murein transglycosylase